MIWLNLAIVAMLIATVYLFILTALYNHAATAFWKAVSCYQVGDMTGGNAWSVRGRMRSARARRWDLFADLDADDASQ